MATRPNLAKAKLVYSTQAPIQASVGDRKSEPAASLAPGAQSVRVQREKAGRGGKVVTVAGPLILTRGDATALLAAWKKLCGSGGALKTGTAPDGSSFFELEVQGDHADRLVAELVKAGYKAKRAGG